MIIPITFHANAGLESISYSAVPKKASVQIGARCLSRIVLGTNFLSSTHSEGRGKWSQVRSYSYQSTRCIRPKSIIHDDDTRPVRGRLHAVVVTTEAVRMRGVPTYFLRIWFVKFISNNRNKVEIPKNKPSKNLLEFFILDSLPDFETFRSHFERNRILEKYKRTQFSKKEQRRGGKPVLS